MDIKSKEARSKNMAAITSKNTKPEIVFRKLLFKKGYRYRLHKKKLPGKPDLYLKKYNTVVFVHGCFWHQHEGCKEAHIPKSRTEFWKDKFEKNKRRDQKNVTLLKDLGIRTLVVWECTIEKMQKDDEYAQTILNKVSDFLLGDDSYREI